MLLIMSLVVVSSHIRIPSIRMLPFTLPVASILVTTLLIAVICTLHSNPGSYHVADHLPLANKSLPMRSLWANILDQNI
jgi:hypothetical protein